MVGSPAGRPGGGLWGAAGIAAGGGTDGRGAAAWGGGAGGRSAAAAGGEARAGSGGGAGSGSGAISHLRLLEGQRLVDLQDQLFDDAVLHGELGRLDDLGERRGVGRFGWRELVTAERYGLVLWRRRRHVRVQRLRRQRGGEGIVGLGRQRRGERVGGRWRRDYRPEAARRARRRRLGRRREPDDDGPLVGRARWRLRWRSACRGVSHGHHQGLADRRPRGVARLTAREELGERLLRLDVLRIQLQDGLADGDRLDEQPVLGEAIGDELVLLDRIGDLPGTAQDLGQLLAGGEILGIGLDDLAIDGGRLLHLALRGELGGLVLELAEIGHRSCLS